MNRTLLLTVSANWPDSIYRVCRVPCPTELCLVGSPRGSSP